MRQMDDNFDGRISYKELREHIRSLGFVVDNDKSMKKLGAAYETFVWRDKGVEVVIRTLN